MAEDAEVRSGLSSTMRSAEKLLASVDIAEDAEVGEGGVGDDETVKRSPLFKNSSGLMRYLTFLRSDTDSGSFGKK